MDRAEARQTLRRVNELHFELTHLREKEEELKRALTALRSSGISVGLIHADFLESCGRYVFVDQIIDNA